MVEMSKWFSAMSRVAVGLGLAGLVHDRTAWLALMPMDLALELKDESIAVYECNLYWSPRSQQKSRRLFIAVAINRAGEHGREVPDMGTAA
jgi:hypothetical protein